MDNNLVNERKMKKSIYFTYLIIFVMANRDLARLLLTVISAASLTLSSALLMASTPSSLQSSAIELLLLRRPVTLSNILGEKRD